MYNSTVGNGVSVQGINHVQLPLMRTGEWCFAMSCYVESVDPMSNETYSVFYANGNNAAVPGIIIQYVYSTQTMEFMLTAANDFPYGRETYRVDTGRPIEGHWDVAMKQHGNRIQCFLDGVMVVDEPSPWPTPNPLLPLPVPTQAPWIFRNTTGWMTMFATLYHAGWYPGDADPAMLMYTGPARIHPQNNMAKGCTIAENSQYYTDLQFGCNVLISHSPMDIVAVFEGTTQQPELRGDYLQFDGSQSRGYVIRGATTKAINQHPSDVFEIEWDIEGTTHNTRYVNMGATGSALFWLAQVGSNIEIRNGSPTILSVPFTPSGRQLLRLTSTGSEFIITVDGVEIGRVAGVFNPANTASLLTTIFPYLANNVFDGKLFGIRFNLYGLLS